jgi:hypothetical protein
LSTRVINVITDGNNLKDLHYLLEFLAAWEKRPECLTPIAYEWCSAVSEAAGRLELDKQVYQEQEAKQVRIGLQNLVVVEGTTGWWRSEMEFSEVGDHCDFLRLDDTSRCAHVPPRVPVPDHYVALLPTTLEIGFRLVTCGGTRPALHLNHTFHHDQVFEGAFSNGNDDLIADAVSAWAVDGDQVLRGSYRHYLAKRMERDTPFSPRLRRVIIHTIELIGRREYEHFPLIKPEVAGLETIHLLNRLEVDVDDMAEIHVWAELLHRVICSPVGLEILSSHYWRLLDKLDLARSPIWMGALGLLDLETMRSLEKAKDWEKLEVWMMVIWHRLTPSTRDSFAEDVEQATRELLLQRTSALPRFKDLCKHAMPPFGLLQICEEVSYREDFFSELLSSPYVSVHSAKHLFVLMPPFVCFSQPIHAKPPVTLPISGDDIFSEVVYCAYTPCAGT